MIKRKYVRILLFASIVAWVFSVLGVRTPLTSLVFSADRSTATSSSGSISNSDPLIKIHQTKSLQTSASSSQHGETLPKVLFLLLLMLVLAKIGGDLFERIHQPAVLGELLFGIVLGNLSLLKLGWMDGFVQNFVQDHEVKIFITLLSEIGVILLLFEVGLESTVREMVSVGFSSFVVAVLGVAAPMLLGFVVGEIFLSDEPWTVHLFLGAVLAATSVGITARVLRDLRRMDMRESKIILGAAVIDDILGLVVLAVAQGIVLATNAGTTLRAGSIVAIAAKGMGFFLGAIIFGRLVSGPVYKLSRYLQVRGVLLTVTLGWCFLISYLGTLFGLAPIVGAFAAGLVLEDTTFEAWKGKEVELEDLLRPLTTFLVPVFFVNTGMNVDLSTFGNVNILGFAAALTFVAILGKQVCALGVMEKGLNRMAIGIGMIPRGEVGLIVANIGRTMKTAEGHSVISSEAFSATVIMVVVTTMITPPFLKWSLDRGSKKLNNQANVGSI